MAGIVSGIVSAVISVIAVLFLLRTRSHRDKNELSGERFMIWGFALMALAGFLMLASHWPWSSTPSERAVVHLAAVVQGGGLLTAMLGLMRWHQAVAGLHGEITASRIAAGRMSAEKHRVEVENHLKSEFLAGMSHELRTPLNAIIGFSQALSHEVFGPLQNPKYREYANDIVNAGQHLLDLINDVLDVSKIEAGRMELHEEIVDMGDVLRCAERLVREQAGRRGVRLEFLDTDTAPVLYADRRRMKQMLINLLTNAIKFTEAGGTVRTWVRREGGGDPVIEVEDTGIGMRPEDLAKALSPFGQVDNSMVRKQEGTGLGLPLTGMFAELHGGCLELESVPGEGTRARIRLPAERIRATFEEQRVPAGLRTDAICSGTATL